METVYFSRVVPAEAIVDCTIKTPNKYCICFTRSQAESPENKSEFNTVII